MPLVTLEMGLNTYQYIGSQDLTPAIDLCQTILNEVPSEGIQSTDNHYQVVVKETSTSSRIRFSYTPSRPDFGYMQRVAAEMMVRASKHPFNVEESVVEAWTPGVWLDRPFPRPSRHTRLRQEWLNQPPLELKLALSPLVMAKQPHIAYFNIQADSLVGIINDIIGNRYTVGYGVSKPLAASKDVLLDIKMPRPSEQSSPRKSYLEYIAQLAGEFLDTIPEFESHNAAVYVKPSNPYTQSITRL